jgi:kynurenine formamidase
MKYIDLTHTFTSDMPVYPGDQKATLEQVAYIEKDTYNDHKITSVMHVGTHMDAPLHMIAIGKKVDEFSLGKLIGKGVVIDARGKNKIDISVLEDINIEQGSIVLLYTGFGEKYRTDDYFKGYPELSEDFAKRMVQLKVKIVGMDMLGPDYDKPWATQIPPRWNETSSTDHGVYLESHHLVGKTHLHLYQGYQSGTLPLQLFLQVHGKSGHPDDLEF